MEGMFQQGEVWSPGRLHSASAIREARSLDRGAGLVRGDRSQYIPYRKVCRGSRPGPNSMKLNTFFLGRF